MLAHAWNSGQVVSYWREEPLEVDGILEGSWGKWAIEVKTGNSRRATSPVCWSSRAVTRASSRWSSVAPMGRATAERAVVSCGHVASSSCSMGPSTTRRA